MWGVGDHPQPVRPGYHRADAALLVPVLEKFAILAALRVGGQVGIDATDLARARDGDHFLLALDHAKFHRGSAACYRVLIRFGKRAADEGEADKGESDALCNANHAL